MGPWLDQWSHEGRVAVVGEARDPLVAGLVAEIRRRGLVAEVHGWEGALSAIGAETERNHSAEPPIREWHSEWVLDEEPCQGKACTGGFHPMGDSGWRRCPNQFAIGEFASVPTIHTWRWWADSPPEISHPADLTMLLLPKEGEWAMEGVGEIAHRVQPIPVASLRLMNPFDALAPSVEATWADSRSDRETIGRLLSIASVILPRHRDRMHWSAGFARLGINPIRAAWLQERLTDRLSELSQNL